MKLLPQERGTRAFTLIEVITVIVIISILLALVGPTTTGMRRSYDLSTSADELVQRLNLARQHAMTENKSFEVRFYWLESDASDEMAFRAFSLWQSDQFKSTADGEGEVSAPSGGRQISGIYRLPTGIVLSADSLYTSILDDGTTGIETEYPDTDAPVSFASIVFNPNGTIRGSVSDKYFTTFLPDDFILDGDDPADFITVQIDPVSGGIQTYRP